MNWISNSVPLLIPSQKTTINSLHHKNTNTLSLWPDNVLLNGDFNAMPQISPEEKSC